MCASVIVYNSREIICGSLDISHRGSEFGIGGGYSQNDGWYGGGSYSRELGQSGTLFLEMEWSDTNGSSTKIGIDISFGN